VQPFRYVRPADEAAALKEAAAPGAAFIGGGTLLVDLMKLGVATPAVVVDVTGLSQALAEIKEVEGAKPGLVIGALARNSDVAYHPAVRERYPALSQALLSGASPQVRNMATVGGNLMQRTRCAYFRDVGVRACNKRAPGSGCAALAEGAWTRMHAVLGGSPRCIAVHPSDMCVALVALGATVHTRRRAEAREIAVEDFHALPGEHPEVETALRPGELITHVTLPAAPFAARSRYVKVRDRAAFAFALASAAVALDLDGKMVRAARVALGGLGTKPWRSHEAEAALAGQPATRASFERAAALAVRDARPTPGNAFKVRLGERTIVRALELAAEGA
jgi:xanthine dehydrogenase YagS FAD-binding subunit